MQDFREWSARWIQAHEEEILRDLISFCRIRSVSRADLAKSGAPFGEECRAMLDFALAHARKMGFQTEDHQGYCGSAIFGDGGNAIGILSHIDVVPEGENWHTPPFDPVRKGEFLFGRGVADNKCAAVMGLYLMRMFREGNFPLRHGLRVLFGCSEETGMQDLSYYARHCTPPVVSLIPDSKFPTNYAQKGSMSGTMRIGLGEQIAEFSGGEVPNMVPPGARALLRGIRADDLRLPEGFAVCERDGTAEVSCRGVAAHAARPEKGISAIHLLSKALCECGVLRGQSLEAMRAVREVTSDYYGANMNIALEDPDTGKTTMVVGRARTEQGELVLSLDCRLSIAANLQQTMENFVRAARCLGLETMDMATTPPVFISREDARVRATQEAYREETGDDAPAYTTGGGTYARVMPNALTFGLSFPGESPRPTGLPASHGGAHAPDEFLHIPSFFRAMKIYALAIPKLDRIV